MKRIEFWFDVISPFAYLAFERLPQVLEGCNYAVEYRPVLFAGLLRHWGQQGPAEVEPKRAWTFRQVHWIAAQHGIAMQTPALHPFNPLALLRLAVACGPNRHVVQAILRHVWTGGGDAQDATRLSALTAELAPALDPDSEEVRLRLREAGAGAIAQGIFGVPSLVCEGRVFWGLDALPMLRGALLNEAWFEGPAWDQEGRARPGITRS